MMEENKVREILEDYKLSKVFKEYFDSLSDEGYDELVHDIIHGDKFTHEFTSWWDVHEIYCNNCKCKKGEKRVLCKFCFNQVNFELDGEIKSIRFTKKGIDVTIQKERELNTTILKWKKNETI